ncbi:UDP-glucoronosyl and UDP-glucosyl transferase [Musa troglodytarum]|uniref:UDP-glucoronosyl and UDP-glucosyl transferase n=1 Tax=Musa troglodytarum TaxID=320322 RepID=A0A9E7ELJ2_9LILI|nr:UDP-glucoronosyl and UDP-glucosyl transferase [Musa troglodytarum]
MTDTYGLLLTAAGNLQDSSPGTRIHPNHSLAELVVGPARPRASELAIAVGMTRVSPRRAGQNGWVGQSCRDQGGSLTVQKDRRLSQLPWAKLFCACCSSQHKRPRKEKCAGSPDWIIIDSFYWVPRVAAGLGVHCAYVSLITVTANAFIRLAFLLAIGDRGHRVKPEVLHDMVELRGLGVSGAYRLGCSLSGCDVVVVRSCPELELEPEWLSFLGWLCGKPVLALGHLPPAAMKHDAAGSFTEGNDFFRWLGKREVRSVVYVSFESELLLTREQAHEVADGHELSNLPFTGALRSEPDALSPGFDERTRAGGLFGLPLVLLPLANDEGLNAHLMAEKKVGVEVPRREEARPSMGLMSQGQ